MVFFLSCRGKVAILLQLQQEPCLLKLPQGSRIFSEVAGGTRGSSGIATGQSGLLSSCGGTLGLPLKRQWGSSGSSQVATGVSGLVLSFLGTTISSRDVHRSSCLVAMSGGCLLVLA